jgi:hypothetical protein
MIPLQHLFDFYSKRHYEFNLGWSVVGQATSLLAFETFAMVFCDKFGIVGYPAMVLYFGAPAVALIGITFMGYKMIQSGYATKYANYGSNVNSDWVELTNNVKAIRNQLEEVQERK